MGSARKGAMEMEDTGAQPWHTVTLTSGCSGKAEEGMFHIL